MDIRDTAVRRWGRRWPLVALSLLLLLLLVLVYVDVDHS